MLASVSRQSTARLVVRCASRASSVVVRGFATSGDEQKGEKKREMPFGLSKIFDLGEPDNKIASPRDHKLKKGDFPDYIPEDVKKDLDELGVDNMEDLDDLEDAGTDGYNELGLVPPEGTGTFRSPILVPSRRASRQVGYVDPASHAVYWFTIHNDENTYYIKDLGLFFKMLHIPDDRVHEGGHH
ncbi:hypothetical protein ACA910_007810 [Epithemia clementina (nom. ined.)]